MNENENVQNLNGSETPVEEQAAAQPTSNENPQPQVQYVYTQSTVNKQSFDFGKEMGNTFTDALGVLKAPADFIPKYVGKASVIASLTITVIYAIVRIIFGMINTAIVYNGAYSYYTSGFKALRFVGSFFSELLIAAATMAIIAALAMACGSVLGKTKVSFIKGLSIASLYVIPVIPAVILNFLFGLASIGFGSLFMFLAQVIGIIFVAMALKSEVKDDNKLPYAVAVIFFCVSLAQWILAFI